MTLNSDEMIWWNTLKISWWSLIAFAMAFTSATTDIAVNQKKNIIQHPYWDKIYPFWDDYAHIQSILFQKFV